VKRYPRDVLLACLMGKQPNEYENRGGRLDVFLCGHIVARDVFGAGPELFDVAMPAKRMRNIPCLPFPLGLERSGTAANARRSAEHTADGLWTPKVSLLWSFPLEESATVLFCLRSHLTHPC